MEKLFIEELVSATNGKLELSNNNSFISSISIDSREKLDNSLFIAIIGERLDGHCFLEDAYQNGYRTFIIDNDHTFFKDDINLIKVENTTKALGYISKYYKEKYNITSIGVTGSVGKTSTKDIIYSVLKEKYNTLKNEGNLNNEIGLPKTLFNLNDTYEVAVLEMGMSFKDEIKHLADITRPNIAVISNVGMSHIENFDNQDGIFNAKMEIASYFKEDNILIVNGDDSYLSKLKKENLSYKLITYGFDDDNDIVCTSYKIMNDKINFVAKYNGEEFNCLIPTVAKHNIYNSMAAIVIGKLLNIETSKIIEGLNNFQITKGRLTVINKKDITIIDDSYNASYDSMVSALNVLKLYNNRKIAILGDILETGDYEEEIHRNVGKHILNNCDILITVGKSSLYIKDEAIKQGFLEENIYSYDNSDLLINEIDNLIKQEDTILLKASHGINLNKVVTYLEENYEN